MKYDNTSADFNQPPFSEKIDFNALPPAIIAEVAYELMPDRFFKETDREIRFGNRGSFAICKQRGTFFDHEQQVGGGLLNMICHLKGFERKLQAVDWLQDKGFIDGTFTKTHQGLYRRHIHQNPPQPP